MSDIENEGRKSEVGGRNDSGQWSVASGQGVEDAKKSQGSSLSSLRILALETTSQTGSVAVLEGGSVLAAAALNPQQRSAQSLAPGIRKLLGEVGWQPADVQLVAVAVGPGSFTGLRVGVTTAKVLAYALGAEIIGVNTLAAIAEQAPAEVGRLHVVMDAFRGQVFAVTLVRDANGWFQPEMATTILDEEVWLNILPKDALVSGPVLKKLAARLPSGAHSLPPELWEPSATSVGQIARRHYQSGHRDDVWKLAPKYYRRSAAEEKRDADIISTGQALGEDLPTPPAD